MISERANYTPLRTCAAAGGVRGGVSIHVRPDVDVQAGVRCLHAAAAAVLPEIREVV